MIELAHQHKIGLMLANPVMIAAGFAGYGKAYHGLINIETFGAIVTNPITLRPERGTTQPRLAETSAGFILNTGQQNPGVKKVIKQNQNFWAHLKVPLIAHLPADEPSDLHRTARALASITTPQGHPLIAAFELGLPPECTPRDVKAWLEAIQSDAPLPVLIKLPLGAPLHLIEAAAASAVALVISTPPLGSALNGSELVIGHLYGAALHSLILQEIQLIRQQVDLPLVAVGGIHTLADVQNFLSHGATAVQLDSLLFIDPQQAEMMAAELTNGF